MTVMPRASSSAPDHFAVTEYVAEYHGADWPETVQSRPGWRVICPTCGPLADGYAYRRIRSARGSATKHKHRWARAPGSPDAGDA